MGKSFKFKDNYYLDSSGIAYNHVVLKNYLENNTPKGNYSEKGGWFKLFKIPPTPSYTYKIIRFALSGSSNNTVYGTAEIGYYNNDRIRANIIDGNFGSNSLGYIKNSDNSVDVYYKTSSWYSAVVITPIITYPINMGNLWDNNTLPAVVTTTPSITGYFQ